MLKYLLCAVLLASVIHGQGSPYYQIGGSGYGDAGVAICASIGLQYASIHNAEQNAEANQVCPDQCWMGYHDSNTEGSWEWYDGTPNDYTNWNNNEPNNSGDCGVLNADGTWNDGYCDWGHMPILCMGYTTTAEPTTTAPTMHAPSCCTCVEAEHPSWGTVPAQCSGDQQYASYAPMCYMADDDACTAKMASGSIPGAFWGYCVEDVDEEANCEIDCAGVVGGSSEVDECGVCGGDGSSCATTTPEPTTTSAAECAEFDTKKSCKKESPDELNCVWNKWANLCHDDSYIPNCSDYHGEKKACKKEGCVWNKYAEMCGAEGEVLEVTCSDYNGNNKNCKKVGGCSWDKTTKLCSAE